MRQFKKLLCLFIVIVACCWQQSVAQQQMPNIPVDPNVRIGKLSNGLTYYIRHNALPEKRAFFYIAQKVGSIQEEPQQRGLAHFLEHMCFNGTKHFPGNSLISYLEKIGVKFGENLNAYTSIDETVYNIDNVPTTVPTAIDSCLYILHDWSNDLTLDPTEIDKERGVINEEWRSRRTAQQRMQEAMSPIVMKGSKYEDCLPIGTMDVVMHFKPQTLRDYYEKWYRPDLQGVVVVGDINVDEIEAKIKQIFSDIPAQPNAAKRIYYPVADNKEPIVAIMQDKENAYSSVNLLFKHEAVPDSLKSSIAYLVQNYATDVISNMLNARLSEITQKANPPFTGAGVFDGNFYLAKTKGAFMGYAGLKENDNNMGLEALYREMLRAKRNGFTESEYTRARADLLRSYESLYNERDKQESNKYVDKYVRNFLDNEPIPSIEQDYNLINKIAPNIPVQAINQMLPELMTDSNLVVIYQAPEKEGIKLPTKENLLNAINKVNAEKIAAYVDKVSNEPLMATKPKAGKIVSTKQNAAMGTTEMILSNGAKVVIKKTDFKKDEIRMHAVSKGGNSLFPDKEFIDFNNMNDVIALGGIGKFSATDLQKVLAGKMASASAAVNTNSETVNASCSPKDAETMMQLVYLTFTSPRKDLDAFNSFKTRMKADLKNQELDPNTTLRDSLRKAIYNDNLRATSMKENMVDKISYDNIFKMYKNRFCDASDFTFFFVGNIDINAMKPFIEQYIASLPSIHRKEMSKPTFFIRKGVYTNEFLKQQQTPTSTVVVYQTGSMPYTLKNDVLTNIYAQILDIVYTKTIREDAGAAYSVYVGGDLNYYPKPSSFIEISFPTAPEKKTTALKLVNEGIDNLIKKGPDQKDLDKVKEFMLKKYAESVKENSYWMNILSEQFTSGIDFSKNYEATVKGITVKDIQDFAAGLKKQNNFITVTMTSLAKK